MLKIQELSKTYKRVAREPVHALRGVHLEVPQGKSVGLVGESGSGKSTLLRCLLKLTNPDSGSITFEGADVTRLRGKRLRTYRQNVQMVFQDPSASLNPRMTVAQLVAEGLLNKREKGKAGTRKRVFELLDQVGMPSTSAGRHPTSFSGGQLQRISIARALAVEPRLLVCDEPVSALDVSVQAQVLNLLLDMQKDLGLSILFVSHDLAVIRYICPQIYVLAHGEIVEEGTREQIFEAPHHSYTQQLIAAVPHHDFSAAHI